MEPSAMPVSAAPLGAVAKKTLPWQAQFNHPNLSGEVRLMPLAASDPSGAAVSSPVQLGISMASSHPLVQQILQQLGPVLVQVLPVLITALIAGSLASPDPAPSS